MSCGDEFSDLDNYAIRSVLGAFLFTGDEVFKELNVLSGGEKSAWQWLN